MKDIEYIRNFNGQILGSIEKAGSNGDLLARDFPSMQILGYYRKAHDHTTNFIGTILAEGNTLASLIYNKQH